MTEGLGPMPSKKKIEAQKETGLVLRRGDIVTKENQGMTEIYQEKKMRDMKMSGQKGGHAMKEMLDETGIGSEIGIGSVLETVSVTEIGIVIENVTGIVIGMTGTDMQIIIDTGNVI